jgi:general secretion pathway protein D
MPDSRRTIRLAAAAALALMLAGCGAQMAYREGKDLVARDQVEAGLLKLRDASARDPGNAQYRSAWLNARDRASTRLLEQAERAFQQGKPQVALQDYKRVLELDPANERARAGLRQVEMDERHMGMLMDAREAVTAKAYDNARMRLQAILTERPSHEGARQLLAQVNELAATPTPETALAAAYKQPITIEFRDAPLKQVFEVVSRRSGLNFLFDKDVKTDQRTSIFLKNSTVEAAIYFLLVTNQLEQQVMDSNTILVYPNVTAKVREYQEMMVKTFYLANAEAKLVANTLKTILKTRDVVVDEKLNLLIVRDSPEAIKLATRLILLQDVPEPEVMLEVEIMEVKRSKLTELGVAWPSRLDFAPLQTFAGPLTIDEIRSLSSSRIGVDGVSATINANKQDGNTNILANPRIRVRNKEKAKVLIGEKVPNITTTISPGSGGFATESVNYVDVGLNLNVEPTIYLNNEVGIRIALEVSNLVDKQTTKSGTTAYQIGTRQASTFLQLKDGENQVLAGLINNEERSSGNKLPGFGDLPVLGRLFGSTVDDSSKTEIVLSITPHLIRTVQRPPAAQSEFSAGTETSFRRRPDPAVRQAVPALTPGPSPVVVPGQTGTVPGQPSGMPPATVAPQPSAVNVAPPVDTPPGTIPSVPAGQLPAAAPSVSPSELPATPSSSPTTTPIKQR